MKKAATKGLRELNRALETELVRDEAERMEQQRIEFEHAARMARTNLYGVKPPEQRGWVDARRR